MRGRTNITPRTGPDVIGTDVTNKQVTGSAISAGDFVKFTGDTSELQTLESSLIYDYANKFRISDTVWGVAFYNLSSKMLKFTILDESGVLNTALFENITVSGFEKPTDKNVDVKFLLNASYVSGYLYVGLGFIGSRYVSNFPNTKLLFAFSVDVSNNYSISRASNKDISTLAIKNNLTNISGISSNDTVIVSAAFIIGSIIYCFVGKPANYLYLVSLRLSDGSYFAYRSINSQQMCYGSVAGASFGSTSAERNCGLCVLDDVIIVGCYYDNNTAMISSFCFITQDTSTGSFTVVTGSNTDIRIRPGFELRYLDGYYFLISFYAKHGATSGAIYVCSFYKEGSTFTLISNNSKSISLDNSSYAEYVPFMDLRVSGSNNEYDITAICFKVFSLTMGGYVFRYACNINGQTLIRGDEKTFSVYSQHFVLAFVFYNSAYNLVFWPVVSNGADLMKQKFVIDSGRIVMLEGFDLVQKVTSGKADGVAKTPGSPGQTITVCIP